MKKVRERFERDFQKWFQQYSVEETLERMLDDYDEMVRKWNNVIDDDDILSIDELATAIAEYRFMSKLAKHTYNIYKSYSGFYTEGF